MTVSTAPSGLAWTLDGIGQTATVTYDELVGFQRTVDTTSPQYAGTTRYWFDGWSDGGLQSHTVTVPAGGLTLTGTFSVANTAPAGLVAAYAFDEGNGGTLRDASGKNIPALSTARCGRAPAATVARCSSTGSTTSCASRTRPTSTSRPA